MRHILHTRQRVSTSLAARPRQHTAYCRPFATGVRICWTTAGSERAHRAIARPRQTKVAHNFPRSFFENCSKRCNSNAMISIFGVVTGELRATFPRNHAHDRSHTPRKTSPDALLQSGSTTPPPDWRNTRLSDVTPLSNKTQRGTHPGKRPCRGQLCCNVRAAAIPPAYEVVAPATHTHPDRKRTSG